MTYALPPIDLPIIKGASRIIDRLYLGDYYDAININHLREIGITHIVNMCPEIQTVKIPGIEYLYINILDVPQAYREMETSLRNIVPIIHNILMSNPNNRVFIHCAYGISRSATMTIGYIMYAYRLSFRDAWSFVNRGRYIAVPNPGFIYTLHKFEKFILTVNFNVLRNKVFHPSLF